MQRAGCAAAGQFGGYGNFRLLGDSFAGLLLRVEDTKPHGRTRRCTLTPPFTRSRDNSAGVRLPPRKRVLEVSHTFGTCVSPHCFSCFCLFMRLQRSSENLVDDCFVLSPLASFSYLVRAFLLLLPLLLFLLLVLPPNCLALRESERVPAVNG